MYKNKGAITIVELIIVISILSILGIVGYLAYGSYLVTVRDSTRLVEIENIETSLGSYVLKSGFYPEPTDSTSVTFTGEVVWYQGTFGNDIANIVGYSSDVFDPLTKSSYTYSIKNSRKEYSLAGVLEERPGLVAFNGYLPQSNAINIGSKKGIAKVVGNYNGEVISIIKNGVTNILAVPSIVSSDLSNPDLQYILDNNKLVYNDFNNLPASYSGTVYNLVDNIDFSPNNLIVFTGSISNLKETYNQVALLQDLHFAYSGSILGKSISVNRIDYSELYSPEPSSRIKVLACDLINFKLKYFVECGSVDFITFFVVNVLHIDISNLPGSKITTVYQDNDGNFVFGTNGGLAFFDGTNWIVYDQHDSGLIHNYITSITQDNSGNYWIGTQNGISKLIIGDLLNKADDIWITITGDSLVSTHIQYIYTDNDGIIWIGTNKGVSSYNGDIWSSYTKKSDGLTHNNITAIFTDSQGHVWFGTNSKGVDKFILSDANCQNYWHEGDDDDHDGHDDDHDGEDHDTHCDHDGHDDHDGDDHGDDDDENDHDGNNNIIINYNSGKLPDHRVTYMFEDNTGKIWIGTQGGIGVTSDYGNTWINYTNSNTSGGLIDDYITYMFQDTLGNVWIGTNNGLSKFDGSTWVNYSTSNSPNAPQYLLGDNIFLIYQDSNGNIMIFSEGGLDTIDTSGNIIT
ncbi:MAG: two-component regulator propeller domain-containing protein [Candidatus Gracilibacteria bacterium]|nr:two-component regulator propeller domain-containing protein [Candidatus Gracilibacteria bacterium]